MELIFQNVLGNQLEDRGSKLDPQVLWRIDFFFFLNRKYKNKRSNKILNVWSSKKTFVNKKTFFYYFSSNFFLVAIFQSSVIFRFSIQTIFFVDPVDARPLFIPNPCFDLSVKKCIRIGLKFWFFFQTKDGVFKKKLRIEKTSRIGKRIEYWKKKIDDQRRDM